MHVSPEKQAYLELLAQQYPTIRAASTEIINLTAYLQLPKGTEHFIPDIHGKYEALYSRGYVRAALPPDFAVVIEELLHEQEGIHNKEEYYLTIIDTIIALEQAGEFIEALSALIQRLAIARLHIIGDIYDRGPGAHQIMDTLMGYHNLDIQ